MQQERGSSDDDPGESHSSLVVVAVAGDRSSAQALQVANGEGAAPLAA